MLLCYKGISSGSVWVTILNIFVCLRFTKAFSLSTNKNSFFCSSTLLCPLPPHIRDGDGIFLPQFAVKLTKFDSVPKMDLLSHSLNMLAQPSANCECCPLYVTKVAPHANYFHRIHRSQRVYFVIADCMPKLSSGPTLQAILCRFLSCVSITFIVLVRFLRFRCLNDTLNFAVDVNAMW